MIDLNQPKFRLLPRGQLCPISHESTCGCHSPVLASVLVGLGGELDALLFCVAGFAFIAELVS